MELGWKNRSTGSTLMNADSSRSHSIFTIHIERCDLDDTGEDHLRAGKLNLVDLAGSERQAKTGKVGFETLLGGNLTQFTGRHHQNNHGCATLVGKVTVRYSVKCAF